ncbi:MAG: SDR family oxidoreductase [Saprospiraceae bacterium]|nr:SDR family oxidoreductase [Saprospiraceae bacterium]MCF8252753.1 SDR family oxidoreductase [Saprospiraceae bacterium]MCF8283125.1 SDR family oxidoreductase [Bacteroidales bacterium]MCF8314311.1 SDR family oxidoreductase [Saprospiraceae bacterium]MCF8443180.1 SDR family oxidoreductase [Saprospiraceae bacterium]
MTKIAIVTGGSRGLGKDMALAIAAKGLDVVLTFNSQPDLAQEVVAEIEALGRKAAALSLNLLKANGIDAFLAALEDTLATKFNGRRPDFLVNNAGMGATIPMAQATEEQFDDFLNVHFKGIYFLTQKLLPTLNDGGGIINISTGTTRFSNPGYSLYASMKGAVEVLTRYIAKEYGSRGIRANVVAPGPVETDFNNAAIRNNPQLKGMLSNMTALGRVGHPDDIGGVVAFLCSDESKWVNGQRIEVSGGIHI